MTSFDDALLQKEARKHRANALALAVEARKGLLAAKENYSNAVLLANRAGVANTKLAKALGMSETAVRMFIKRKRMGQ